MVVSYIFGHFKIMVNLMISVLTTYIHKTQS